MESLDLLATAANVEMVAAARRESLEVQTSNVAVGSSTARQFGSVALYGVPRAVTPTNLANGEVVLPCRARNMGGAHNGRTAFFIIPPGTRHGAELYCSHVECQNDGVKFRFCAHCKIPVAKRNFRKRHMHEFRMPPARGPAAISICDGGNGGGGAAKNDHSSYRSSPTRTASIQPPEFDTALDDSTCSARAATTKQKEDDVREKSSSRCEMKVTTRDSVRTAPVAWVDLYHSRPDEDDRYAMNRWMASVLNVSSRKEQVNPGISFENAAVESTTAVNKPTDVEAEKDADNSMDTMDG